MTRNGNVKVIVDFEALLDSLLSHTKEENCNHSVSDFLQEYFDEKNERRAASQGLQTRANTTTTPTSQAGEDDHY